MSHGERIQTGREGRRDERTNERGREREKREEVWNNIMAVPWRVQ